MFEEMRGYLLYMILATVIAVPIFITPLFLFGNSNLFNSIHQLYSPLCHQITSRSFCYFPSSATIEDCYSKSELKMNKERIVSKNGNVGYKFPVCSRDVGFYLFAFLGGIFLSMIDIYRNNEPPNSLWLILALIPIGLDGGTQLIGMRESTNLIRLITGSIAGFILPFYIIPMLNKIMNSKI